MFPAPHWSYIPAISFLALILLLLVGLCGMYYCLTHDLCPCTQTDADKTGYEELQIGEETEVEDDEKTHTPLPQKRPLEGAPSGDEVDRRPMPVDRTGDSHSDTEVGSIRSSSKSTSGPSLLPGKVRLAAEYFPDIGRVGFSIAEAQNIPSKGKGGGTHARFHVVLLPGKKQRFKTKYLRTPHPKYKETFVFDRLVKEDLYRLAIRLRLYTQSGVSKEKLIGEVNLQMADIAHAPGYRLETWRDMKKPKSPELP